MIVFSIQYINPCDFYVYKTFTKQLKMKKNKSHECHQKTDNHMIVIYNKRNTNHFTMIGNAIFFNKLKKNGFQIRQILLCNYYAVSF